MCVIRCVCVCDKVCKCVIRCVINTLIDLRQSTYSCVLGTVTEEKLENLERRRELSELRFEPRTVKAVRGTLP